MIDINKLAKARQLMAQAEDARRRKQAGINELEELAFNCLKNTILGRIELHSLETKCCVQEDQIVWARSPVRLDLAGGWTDTPPYCLEHGGKVVNLAVDINGQPPIQVFARLFQGPFIVLHSIDLGTREVVMNYDGLAAYNVPASSFALAKAALCLSGLSPKFSKQSYSTLAEQLRDFGYGIELSLLAAVPKGSGLGTSSILAATILAALNRLFGHRWDAYSLFCRTMALEQMITTGGGWQDQAGGMFRGFKMIETAPGLEQKPIVRWLPNDLFSRDYANSQVFLYYTGITRLAKGILSEIVRNIFLNSKTHVNVLEAIAQNAGVAFEAAQRADYKALSGAVQKSWQLNQKMDRGTNPSEVQAIIQTISDYVQAVKLLGAGGGGYMLIMAKDEESGVRIRKLLAEKPPNNRARFVNFSLSENGLIVTES